MKKVNYSLICLSALIIISCNKQSTILKEIVLKQGTIISQFSDSTYFSDIRSLFYDKYLYVSEYQRDQIIILNDKDQVIKTLGMKGRGPEEFLGISHIYVSNDTIYAFNDMKRSIQVYNLGGYINTIPLKKDIQMRSDTRFSCLNNVLYISSVTKENSIAAYDMASDSITRLGKIDRFATEKHTRFRNDRNIFVMDSKYIIATSHVVPVIEKYNLKGELIEQFNFKDIVPVQKRLEFIKTKDVEIAGVYQLISDAYMESNKLYLILVSNEQDKVSSNRLLEIEIGDKMKVTNLYNIGEGWYSAMCISNKILYAFDAQHGNLVKLSLNQSK